jgi:hypothetical protein
MNQSWNDGVSFFLQRVLNAHTGEAYLLKGRNRLLPNGIVRIVWVDEAEVMRGY